jgi:hypothetical protein
MLGQGAGPAIRICQADQNRQRRASTCRVMTIPPNSDAPSATVPCKLSVWSLVFRAYLPGYDVTLLGAPHVSSSPSKRSRSRRNHNASRWPRPSAGLAQFTQRVVPGLGRSAIVSGLPSGPMTYLSLGWWGSVMLFSHGGDKRRRTNIRTEYVPFDLRRD